MEPNIDENIDHKAIVYHILNNLWVYIISCVLAIGIALSFNYICQPQYKVATSLLIREDNGGISPQSIIENQYLPNSSSSNFANQKKIISSYLIINRTIKECGFAVDYRQKGRFHDVDMFGNAGYNINFNLSIPQPIDVRFNIKTLNDSLFVISSKASTAQLFNFINETTIQTLSDINIIDTIKNGDFVDYNGVCLFQVMVDNPNKISQNESWFEFKNSQQLTYQYQQINIISDNESDIITLNYTHENPLKALLFIKTLSEIYLQQQVEKKNIVSNRIIDFIETELSHVTDSLSISEDNLEDFQKSKQVFNIDVSTVKLIESLDENQKTKAKLHINLEMYNYLLKHIQQGDSLRKLLYPSSMGITDPTLDNLIAELTAQLNEQDEIRINSKRESPYLVPVQRKIEGLQKNIISHLQLTMNKIRYEITSVDKNINDLINRMNQIPDAERELISRQRKFKLNDAIYTYLLTKRSEIQISKASTIPTSEILDYARITPDSPVGQNKFKIIFIAFLIGVTLPALFFYVMNLIDETVQSNNDIKNITQKPIIGHIIHNKHNDVNIIIKYPQSLIAESFRTLRTNLQFYLKPNECNLLVTTSAGMSEGKSFVSLNLAASLSLIEKKILIIEFDLRRPSLKRNLNINQERGLSLYLSGNEKDINNILHPLTPQIDIILSGPVPPNPLELINSSYTQTLLAEMKLRYDVIIIDAPPIGLVSDATMLAHQSDLVLMVCRHKVTSKNRFDNSLAIFDKNKTDKIAIVVNDMNVSEHRYGYGRAYGYGYGHGYGYDRDSNSSKK